MDGNDLDLQVQKLHTQQKSASSLTKEDCQIYFLQWIVGKYSPCPLFSFFPFKCIYKEFVSGTNPFE